ncbi:MAG: sulfatase, partial [Pirellulales bacterium]
RKRLTTGAWNEKSVTLTYVGDRVIRTRSVLAKRRGRTALLVLCSLFAPMVPAWGQGPAKPNIIFILADDLGWTDLSGSATNFGYNSDFYETPNLDALATAGMAFTNAYTAGPNCTPTRAALLSGQYAPRPTNNLYTVTDLNRTGGREVPLIGPEQGLPGGGVKLSGAAITIAETLKTAAYVTAHFGKYGVGSTVGESAPLRQGFDYNFGGTAAGTPGQYHASPGAEASWAFSEKVGPELDPYAVPYTLATVPDGNPNSPLIGTRKHLTDAMTEAALDFMEANKEQPFFMNFATYAVHAPTDREQARADLLAKYDHRPPSAVGHNSPSYAALVEGLDQSVGRIIRYLETTDDPRNPGAKLKDNTLVVFTSDNGGKEPIVEELPFTDNGPLKGQKGELDEGGIRVPMIAWMPGRIPAGTVNHTPVTSVDFYPTFAGLAGADLPENYLLDGEDLMPILEDPSGQLERNAIYWHFPGYLLVNGSSGRPRSVIRIGDFKLIYNYEHPYDDEIPPFELYNVGTREAGFESIVPNDLGETVNLALDPFWSDVVEIFSDRLSKWLSETGAALPVDAVTGKRVDYPGQMTGDLDGDGDIDFDDIDTLILGLTKPADYEDLYGISPMVRGDTERDSDFDFDDIAFFVPLLRTGPAAAQAVPEPSTLVLLVVAWGVSLLPIKRRSGRRVP